MSRASVLSNQQPRVVPFIRELRIAWNLTINNSYLPQDDPPRDTPSSVTTDISAFGEFVAGKSTTAMWTEEGGFTPGNFLAGLEPGTGRTVFAPSGGRIGVYNTAGPATPDVTSSVVYEEVLGYNEDEVITTFSGTSLDLVFTAGLQIFPDRLTVNLNLGGNIVGLLTNTYPNNDPEPDSFETSAPLNGWSINETIEPGPFGSFEVALERDAFDDQNNVSGSETLGLTVTVSPWL